MPVNSLTLLLLPTDLPTLDVDGNGVISLMEAVNVPLRNTQSADDARNYIAGVNEEWDKLDTDGDGVISPNEVNDALE